MKNYTVDEMMLRFLDSLVEKASEKLWMLDLIDFDNNPGQEAADDVTYENVTDIQGDSVEPSLSQGGNLTNSGTGGDPVLPGSLKYAGMSGSKYKGSDDGPTTVQNDLIASNNESIKDDTSVVLSKSKKALPHVDSQYKANTAKNSMNTIGNLAKRPKKARKLNKKLKETDVKESLKKPDSNSQTQAHSAQNSGPVSQGKHMTQPHHSNQQHVEQIKQHIRAGNIILPSNVEGNKQEKHVYVRNKRDSDAVLYHHNMMRKTKKEPDLEDYQGEVYSFN